VVAIVSVETVLLIVLLVLVAGLLRSHAEILRRLGPQSDPGSGPGAVPAPPATARSGAQLTAAALEGTTLTGDPVALAFDGAAGVPTLLAFLSSGCTSCASFWSSLAEPRLPAGVQTVIVTHGSDRERPSKLRELAPAGVRVVMSSAAWSDYAVPGSPYFVLVDGFIRGEGHAMSWEALAALVGDAIADQREADMPRVADRRDIDAIMLAGGIGPEHPSLRPGSE
jgi:hypothetical protein